jgi:hypothetical protein
MSWFSLQTDLECIVQYVCAEGLEDELLVPRPVLPAQAGVEPERLRRFPGQDKRKQSWT